MTLKENLIVLDNFLSPDTWTQGAMARNLKGYEVDPAHPDAVKFCLIGAVEKLFSVQDGNAMIDSFNETKTFKESGVKYIDMVNNGPYGYVSIKQIIKDAIANCR